MRKVLQDRFPLAFLPFGAPKAPLKVGIVEDIANSTDLHRYTVRLAVRDYARGRTYHQAAAVAGAVRIDLSGQPVGEVTALEAAFHARHLERITAQRAAKKAGTG